MAPWSPVRHAPARRIPRSAGAGDRLDDEPSRTGSSSMAGRSARARRAALGRGARGAVERERLGPRLAGDSAGRVTRPAGTSRSTRRSALVGDHPDPARSAAGRPALDRDATLTGEHEPAQPTARCSSSDAPGAGRARRRATGCAGRLQRRGGMQRPARSRAAASVPAQADRRRVRLSREATRRRARAGSRDRAATPLSIDVAAAPE